MAARQEADGAEPEELTYRLFRRRQWARLERVTHADAHMLSTLSSNRSACLSRASERPLRRCRVRALIAGLSAVAPPLALSTRGAGEGSPIDAVPNHHGQGHRPDADENTGRITHTASANVYGPKVSRELSNLTLRHSDYAG